MTLIRLLPTYNYEYLSTASIFNVETYEKDSTKFLTINCHKGQTYNFQDDAAVKMAEQLSNAFKTEIQFQPI